MQPSKRRQVHPRGTARSRQTPKHRPHRQQRINSKVTRPLPSPQDSKTSKTSKRRRRHSHHRTKFLTTLNVLRILPRTSRVTTLKVTHQRGGAKLGPRRGLSLLQMVDERCVLGRAPDIRFPPRDSLLWEVFSCFYASELAEG